MEDQHEANSFLLLYSLRRSSAVAQLCGTLAAVLCTVYATAATLLCGTAAAVAKPLLRHCTGSTVLLSEVSEQ